MANLVTPIPTRTVAPSAPAVNQVSQFVRVGNDSPNTLWSQPALARSAFFQANANRALFPGFAARSFRVAPQLAPLANRPAVSFMRGVWDQYQATGPLLPRSASLPQPVVQVAKPIVIARDVERSVPAVQIPLQTYNRAPLTTRASDVASAKVFIDAEPTTAPATRVIADTSSLPTASAITSKVLTTTTLAVAAKTPTAEIPSVQLTDAAVDPVASAQTSNQHAGTQHASVVDKAVVAADTAHTAFTLKAADVAQMLIATTLQPASDVATRSSLSHAALITSAAERAQFSPDQIAATFILARLIQTSETQRTFGGHFLQEVRRAFAELGVLEVFQRTFASRQTAQSMTRNEISAKRILDFIVREIIEKRQLNGLLFRGEEVEDEENLDWDEAVARKDLSNSTNPDGGGDQPQQQPQDDN